MSSNQQKFKEFEKKYPEIIAKSNLSQEQRFARYQKTSDSKFKQVSALEDPIRLAGIKHFNEAIRTALKKLKLKNQKYIQHFELNQQWRKIYNGLLSFNSHQQLSKIVNFKLCQSQGRQKSFFDPFSKNPVSICYNKINRYEQFEKQMIYNLILHYDNKVKTQTNWNLIQPTAKSVIRALNISGLCKRDDKECFEKQLQWRVLDKQRFKGMKINFDELLKNGLDDYEPISQVIFNQ